MHDAKLTIIGVGLDIDGSLVSDSDIRIDGTFHGELITSGKIVISKNGFLDGIVKGKDITVHGKANGDFEALNNFHVAPGGIFEGFIDTRFMIITEAAYFDGSCVINPDKNKDGFCMGQIHLSTLKKEPHKIEKVNNNIPQSAEREKHTTNERHGNEKESNNILNNTISKIKSL